MTTTINAGANTPEGTAAPEGHDAAMVAKFEGQTAQGTQPKVETPPVEGERPSWLPEKFKTPEDMAKAYQALEQKQSAPKTEETKTEGNEPPKPADVKIPDTVEGATEALAGQGLDIGEFSKEFAEKGELTQESYEKLQKAGIPKTMVDAFIEGQKAQAELLRSSVFNEVGGETQFTEMTQWAAKNLPKAEIEAFNAAVDSGDMGQIKLAVQGVNAKFVAANGQEPQLLSGKTTAAAVSAYRSVAEMKADMNDPRYRTDEAFRNDVREKLARSNIM